MLTIKNRIRKDLLLFLTLAAALTGCAPPGPRALIEGKKLMDQGRFPDAVEELKVAASLLSTNAQAWNYLGLAYQYAGQPTNAALSSGQSRRAGGKSIPRTFAAGR